jgi:hypothetical protein
MDNSIITAMVTELILFLTVVGLTSLPYLTPLEAGSVAHADFF